MWASKRSRAKLLVGGGVLVAFVVAAALAMTLSRSSQSAAPIERPAKAKDSWVRAVRLPAAKPQPAHLPAPASPRSEPGATVALARPGGIRVYAAPAAPRSRLNLASVNGLGIVRSFLVKERRGPWLRVMLPVRPNSSLGWIRARDVVLRTAEYRLRVELGRHRLTLLHGRKVLGSADVGAGAPATPTPTGEFYVTDLVRLLDPGGAYGPYALGLSAFSTTIDRFGPGPAQIAIHGTNDPSSIGADHSNGCIRLDNAEIMRLAELVELGTPVTIVP